MNKTRMLILTGLSFVLLMPLSLFAQTYNSASTGADGAFSPTVDTTLTMPLSGIFNFTTVTVPTGVTVTFTPNIANTPVTLLATGDVSIDGVMSVNGENGQGPIVGALVNPGGVGGPGGFAGGHGGIPGASNILGSMGHGPDGAGPTSIGGYGAPVGFDSLIPLFGGSGGGGGASTSTTAGVSGGGGGGAIVIASSSKITINGSLTANGGNGWSGGSHCQFNAGGGGPGAIRLVSSEIAGTGLLVAKRGSFGCGGSSENNSIRLEAFNLTYTGTVDTGLSTTNLVTSVTPGPVTAASTPPLINLPTLSISSVGGIATPVNPIGSFTSADISLPVGTSNPVPVALAATNIPEGTVFTVRIIPQVSPVGPPLDVDSSLSTGTFSTSSALAQVSFEVGQVNLLSAYATFTLAAQTASLIPQINGEPVERIMLAANIGQFPTLTLVTKSGKEIPAKEFLGEEKLALLWKQVQSQK